jgi:2-polyprenyl-6-hydroxyphenyl methylase/3-demethylubiquinone-9 3-methyltransferase
MMRFAFGKNWQRFLHVLDEDRIVVAEAYLRRVLEADRLDGHRFLDVGSGSGLSSLAAWRLGAHVHSFDYDQASVACTAELKRRYAPGSARWRVEQGSALDADYLASLGTFDVVHAWGVLHHTGAMWQALENVLLPLAPGGRLVVTIYNDQGLRSRAWRGVKRAYNALPGPLRIPYSALVIGVMEGRAALRSLVTLRPHVYVRGWTHYGENRGMSKLHDWIDWIGGYPFEVARPEQIFAFYRRRGLALAQLETTAGLGCNHFVFTAPARAAAGEGARNGAYAAPVGRAAT